MYRVRPDGPKRVMELRHRIVRLTGWYPRGPIRDGHTPDNKSKRTMLREHDLVRFIAEHGGDRLCRADTLTIVR